MGFGWEQCLLSNGHSSSSDANAALEAICIVYQYMQLKFDVPACHIDDDLSVLARKVRLKVTNGLMPSTITSYFSRKAL